MSQASYQNSLAEGRSFVSQTEPQIAFGIIRSR